MENYKLNYLSHKYYHSSEDFCESVTYKFCGIKLFVIATDNFGCQACYHGRFYGNYKSIMDGVSSIRGNEKECIKFFLKMKIKTLPILRKYWWKHFWYKIKGKYHYCANDINFPEWALGMTTSFPMDLFLYIYGYIKYGKRLLFWDVFKHTGNATNFAKLNK